MVSSSLGKIWLVGRERIDWNGNYNQFFCCFKFRAETSPDLIPLAVCGGGDRTRTALTYVLQNRGEGGGGRGGGGGGGRFNCRVERIIPKYL